MSSFCRAVLILAFAFASLSSVAQESAGWLSKNRHFRVSYTSDLDPLVINRMHSWTLHVDDAGGNAVSGASMTMTGGMPKHNHGLPTNPRMTVELGNGDYLFEGMRFHMNGEWELTVTIEKGDIRDVVVIALTL